LHQAPDKITEIFYIVDDFCKGKQISSQKIFRF